MSFRAISAAAFITAATLCYVAPVSAIELHGGKSTSVPAPVTLSLLGLGLLGVGFLRRRK